MTAKTNSPSGPDDTPTDCTPATRDRWRLKPAMLATLTRPVTTTRVVTALPVVSRPAPGRPGAPRARHRRCTGISSSLDSSFGSEAAASASAAAKSGVEPERREARIGVVGRVVVDHAGQVAFDGRRLGRGRDGGVRRSRLGDRLGRRRPRGSPDAAVSGCSVSATASGGLGDRLGGRLDRVARRRPRSAATGSGSTAGVSTAGSCTRRRSALGRLASSNGGGSGRVSAIEAKRVGSSSASRRSKNVGHLGLEGGDARTGRARCAPRCRAACASISRSRLVLAVGDALVGLFADPRDLGLRPVADAGDVVVGLLAQLGRLDRRCWRGCPRCGPWPRR